jgi:hypothetical protein
MLTLNQILLSSIKKGFFQIVNKSWHKTITLISLNIFNENQSTEKKCWEFFSKYFANVFKEI